ncbi:MAG: SCO family protein [Anaerolineae bacterium]
MTTHTIGSPARSRSRRPAWSVRAAYVAVALLVVAVLAFAIGKPLRVLPRISLAPGYAFTNQDGAVRTSEDYRGKITLYSFTYTGCGVGCPQTSDQVAALRQRLAESKPQGVDVALVTITVDPEYDTPQALARFAAKYPGDASIPWDFLTGDPLKTKYTVGGGFGVYYDKKTGYSTSLRFEPHFVLVDGWGIIRADYRTSQLDQTIVLRDLQSLADEARNSTGLAHAAYEAAHFFRCYQ